MATIADGMPTKDFFVEMLTRDIDLYDAILDLLDNCLDGVLRQKGAEEKRATTDYYSGFHSKISINTDRFEIADNCGGIPRETAEKYAFRMGRSPEKTGDGLPTVGIYGIGMKRAIFKLGKSAKVITRNAGEIYQVLIPTTWASELKWDFPIEELDDSSMLKTGGTEIRVTDFNPSIAERWSNAAKIDIFVNQLIKMIQQCYSFIIQKGFTIEVNGIAVQPLQIQLLLDLNANASRISPYIFRQTFDDVDVSLAVGFYAPPPSPDDIEDELHLKRSSSDAGWTVICNDRVVLYNDKSHITGWGEAGVPQYHTQFIGIRGIVIFESKNPKNLPMTTTKRGIDTSSKIYAAVKDRMRQGLQLFTDYTNKWKGQTESERKYSAEAIPITIDKFIGDTSELSTDYSIKLRQNKGGLVYTPSLPIPENDKPFRVIHFSRDMDEILDITEFFYNDRKHPIKPSQVGEKCFDTVLAMAKERVRE